MNRNIFAHSQITKELTELYERKNHDYGNSFGETFKEFGLTMCAIRLDDKLRRFKQLIKTEQKVHDESIRDTIIDLANYAIMTVMELDKINPSVENSQRELLLKTRKKLESYVAIRKFNDEEGKQINEIMALKESDIANMDTFELSGVILKMYGLLEKETKPMFKK